jgi:hypothetical protein
LDGVDLAPSRYGPATSVRSIRLGFLGRWLFRCEDPRSWGLDFLGFPWGDSGRTSRTANRWAGGDWGGDGGDTLYIYITFALSTFAILYTKLLVYNACRARARAVAWVGWPIFLRGLAQP